MSKEKNPNESSGDQPEVKQTAAQPGGTAADFQALFNELQAMRTENQQIRGELAQMRMQQSMPQQPVQANIVVPNPMEERMRDFERRMANEDARQVEVDRALRNGTFHYRIGIFAADQCRAFKPEDVRQPWGIKMNPVNPWRVVGANADTAENAEAVAKRKYDIFFGINGVTDGARYIMYACDEEGNPLSPLEQRRAA